ncbi:MAG: helicase C-terminal domain-containing protein [Lapillicoccus sp.]
MSDFLTWLVSRDVARLAEILRNRPEVLHGSSPADLAAVESRLTQHHAIESALLRQPRPTLQVLTALLLLGGHASVAQCAGVLDQRTAEGDHLDRVREWLGRLEEYGLAWTDADEVAHAAPFVDALLAVPYEWGEPARTILEAFSRDALNPTLKARELARQNSKAATVAVLAEAFGDPARLAKQLERLTPPQRAILAESDSVDLAPRIADHRWITERAEAYRAAGEAGLLFSTYAYSPLSGEVPAEVRIALRDERLPFDPMAPSLPTTDVSADMVERESKAALELFNDASLTVLDHIRGQPLKGLQNGGVGAREITRVAKASRVDPSVVRLVLDLACAAGLVEQDGPVLWWGDVTRAWRDLDAGSRVTLLIEQWLRIPRSPTQSHDASGKSLPVGDQTRDCPLCRDGRITTLGEWAQRESAVADAAMAAQVAWSRPLTHTSHREVAPKPDSWEYGWRGRRSVSRASSAPPMLMTDDRPSLGTIADEARLLGLVAHGAGTPLLRRLLADDRPALLALADAMLPAAARTATFGSDLTAVVVGPPTGELSALLDSCADREGRGGAATWRFSTASVRRALDTGSTAAQLAYRLTEVAASGLPQPLSYLLADVGRRHGTLQVAAALAVIRCEDQALLMEVTVDRKLRKLALRLVAPTIAVSTVGEAETIAALRGAGYLPMPETRELDVAPTDVPEFGHVAADANVIDLARRRPAQGLDAVLRTLQDVRRVGLHRTSATALKAAPTLEDAVSAAARLQGIPHALGSAPIDPRLVAAIRRANRRLAESEIATLAEAILAGESVRIRYRSASSSVTERVVSELELSGHLLGGWCHLRNAERVFRVAEILSVAYP